MLAQLSIRNIVLIDSLDIEFSEGLSVLTGETGAGKSILLDSLSLSLGARGDGSLVRKGCEEGYVSALFELSPQHPVFSILDENGLGDSETLILRRVQKADGKTRAFINDSPVSAGLLRSIGTLLVEVHGQHDDRALLDPATHRELLDAHGGLESLVTKTSSAWIDWSNAMSGLTRLRADVEKAKQEAEYLRSSSKELAMLSPEAGEEENLATRRQMMMRAEQIATDLSEANEILSGNGSPVTELSNLARRLERKRESAPGLLEETLDHLDGALDRLYQAQGSIETAFNASNFDPRELETSEERLFALRAAARKYSVPVDELAALAVKMEDDLAVLENGEERLGSLEKECDALENRYRESAMELSRRRAEAAESLHDCVMNELPDLKLEQAEFIVVQKPDESGAGPHGIDAIEFWVRTNPGTNAGPMRKVASGGELSRFMLALKVALADRGSAPTLVFDEIDAGAGGAVADAIGQRLARLAEGVQVLSVTHAPQVAARANGHFLITKSPNARSGSVETGVCPISKENRLEEIARMLSGASITNEARAAAEKLISQSAA